jgi:hypothetical protein
LAISVSSIGTGGGGASGEAAPRGTQPPTTIAIAKALMRANPTPMIDTYHQL